jgi:hypothetical protein
VSVHPDWFDRLMLVMTTLASVVPACIAIALGA